MSDDYSHKDHFEPLAIIGMGCHLPGAADLDAYWKLLLDHRSAISTVPESRLNRELYYDKEKGVRGKTYMTQAGLIDYPAFDQSLCKYPTHVMDYIEVGHLMMVQVAARACRQAGLNPFDLPIRKTGVYIGNNQSGCQTGNLTYAGIVAEAAQYLMDVDAFRRVAGRKVAGREATSDQSQKIIDDVVREIRSKLPLYGRDGFPSIAFHASANAVSDALNLNGPSMILDAACSSSLKALALAAQDIHLGNIDMAIVGGSSFFTSDSLLVFSNAQSGSATGSFPFSEKADGLISAEGHVAVLVKSLDRALADGDPIQAVVTGIGVSSDGRGKSLWAPRKEGQVMAIRRAYRDAADMERLDYLEAHATSTHLGDQTELEAMAESFVGRIAPARVPMGGVKANIGHALEAAGVAGLIKSVLILQRGIVPKQINCTPLNQSVDWKALPFYVPMENKPLPERKDGMPRRAAVNAFGIGGMNVHVVLEECHSKSSSTVSFAGRKSPSERMTLTRRIRKTDEPIAVTGIGVLLPGARTAEAFAELVFSGRDPSSEVDGRWNTETGFSHEKTDDPWKTSVKRGGFVTGFEYDWKRHKIPPKHIAMADPLQFMILDCVDAALAEAGYDKNVPKDSTGVVVGSMFETDNSTRLCMDYRLPHFQRELRRVLKRYGIVDEKTVSEILDRYGELLFRRMPALLDETGSFTPSSLASRITKTYDLLGGAATINTGDTVGLAAIMQAVNALRVGRCDLMICAAGSRLMALSQFIRFERTGRLASGGRRNLLDEGTSGQIPAEGAGALILKRLSDARRDGDRIHCVIHGIGAGFDADPHTAFSQAMENAWKTSEVTKTDVTLLEAAPTSGAALDAELDAVRSFYGCEERLSPLYVDRADAQVGHALAASGFVSLLKAGVELENLRVPRSFGYEKPAAGILADRDLLVVPDEEKPLPVISKPEEKKPRILAGVSSWDPCGSAYHLVVERGTRVAPENDTETMEESVVRHDDHVAATKPNTTSAWKIVRLEAASRDELLSALDESSAGAENVFRDSDAPGTRFRDDRPFRAAVVAGDVEDLRNKIALARKLAFSGKDDILAQKGVFVGQAVSGKKTAFLFSGQGSQYPGMLKSLVPAMPETIRIFETVAEDLRRLGLSSFSRIAWEETDGLGKDVFQTQLSLLCADTILFRTLELLGVTPHVVAGHSFGEFPALHAAGAWTFTQAALATRLRCDAILACKNAEGAMLSTTWNEEAAGEVCKRLPGRIFVANINAPDQTILGGDAAAVEETVRYISEKGGVARKIPVPRPFHTKLMAEVREPLYGALGEIETRNPELPFFSSVTNRYVTESDTIRNNLAEQMTAPVRYIDLIRKLQRDGVGFFVECGPGGVLTGLHRRILGDSRAVAIASDQKKSDTAFPLLCVRACLETFDADFYKPKRFETDMLPVSHNVTKAVTKTVTNKLPAKNTVSEHMISPAEFDRWNRSVQGGPPVDTGDDEYLRYSMRIVRQPLDAKIPNDIPWNGRSLIVGDNAVADALEEKIRQAGGKAVRLPRDMNRDSVAAEVERLWKNGACPHLFLATAHDPEIEIELSEDRWNARRDRGVFLPFLVAQKWMQLLTAEKLVAKATLCTSTVLGGDFGYGGNVRGIDGAALAGLTKSLLLEAGFPTEFAFFAKQIDFSGTETPEFCAEMIFREFATKIPFEMEAGYIGTERYLSRPIPQPAVSADDSAQKPSGNWIVTGGARGITALAATALAREFGVRLHLLGSSELPEVDPKHHELSEQEKKELKKRVMAEAVAKKQNGLQAWSRFERDMELDASLREIRRQGVDFRYYRCDISDRRQVEQTLETIRNEAGSIDGILHGAGFERSCRIEKKVFADVEKTFKVKTDGAAILMDLTRNDPIRHFIAFGSISGHVGAIGQTDYCMANAAMAKLCDWYQTQRPEVRVTCFHWGPWAEVGMAARPEMLSNPILATVSHVKPKEGLHHLIREILASQRTVEEWMVDWKTYKMYYPDRETKIVETNVTETKMTPPAPVSVRKSTSDSEIRRMIVRWVDGTPKPAERELVFHGAALIVGKNRDAEMLHDTLAAHGVKVGLLETEADEKILCENFDRAWNELGPVSHLFLFTGRDPEAVRVSDSRLWKERYAAGFRAPQYLLQQWLRKINEAKITNRSVLAAATAMNGDLGISGGTTALESAGIAGLLKSIHQEIGGSKREGLGVHIVDFPVETEPERVVVDFLSELTLDGFDLESGYVNGNRRVPRLVNAPIENSKPVEIRRGSTWVFTGGARGITAETAKAMGIRYGVKLHLLGSTARTEIDPSLLNLSPEELKPHKKAIVSRALKEGKRPDKEWTRFSNALEIERNLRTMEEAGIDVTYHRCDLLDPAQIETVFENIVRRDGPVYGIVHGAGVSGNPNIVRNMLPEQYRITETTVGLKVDATFEMLRHTDPEELRYFIGFASISGRFGSANSAGYSAANEMLCKIMGRLNRERPRCRAVGIHWHGWGDVGMMTRPTSSGAVNVLKMQLLPPTEGVRFLFDELEAGLPENEIVVSDSQYYSIFHSSEMLVDATTPRLPDVKTFAEANLFEKSPLPVHTAGPMVERLEGGAGRLTLFPGTDPFLIDHRFRGRPFLPAVISVESFLETARLTIPGRKIIGVRDVELLHGLRFADDKPVDAKIVAEIRDNTVTCKLIAPGGKLVPEREYATGTVLWDDAVRHDFEPIPPVGDGMRHPISYADEKAMMYHGPVFRHSREAVFTPGEVWVDLETLPLTGFAGPRGENGWMIHPAAVDACLYMCGVCVWLETGGSIALPHRIGFLKLNRLPAAGEKCVAYIRFKNSGDDEVYFDVRCRGKDGEPLFDLDDYCCKIVPVKAKQAVASKT